MMPRNRWEVVAQCFWCDDRPKTVDVFISGGRVKCRACVEWDALMAARNREHALSIVSDVLEDVEKRKR